MPHAHFLIITKDRCDTPEKVDKYISAEIPDPRDKLLFDTALKNMIHGKNGECDRRCLKLDPKTNEYVCSKNYPKSFRDETSVNEDGYPTYKRSSGKRVLVHGHEIDSSRVVPYNPDLCRSIFISTFTKGMI